MKIGDEVTITALGGKGPQVRLGFTAPHNVAVHREEIYLRIQADRSATEDAHEVIGDLVLVPR